MLAPSMQKWAAHRNLWPTPTARDHKDTGDLTGVPENSLLPRVVARMEREMWPTPTKSDGEGGPGNSGRDGGENLRTAAGGSLNPTFVEWLQGFPKNWTEVPGPVGSGPACPESLSASPSESTDSEPSGTPSSLKSPNG
jgi:hypothetical protein